MRACFSIEAHQRHVADLVEAGLMAEVMELAVAEPTSTYLRRS